MYDERWLPITPTLAARDVEMPIDILFAFPGLEAGVRTGRDFNILETAVAWPLGGARDWQSATRVFNPRIWAPAWNLFDVTEFVRLAFTTFARHGQPFPNVSPESLRVPDF